LNRLERAVLTAVRASQRNTISTSLTLMHYSNMHVHSLLES